MENTSYKCGCVQCSEKLNMEEFQNNFDEYLGCHSVDAHLFFSLTITFLMLIWAAQYKECGHILKTHL